MLSTKRKLSDSPVKDAGEVPSVTETSFKVLHKNDENQQDLEAQIREVKLRIKEKEETLRKLKLVHTYRTKWEVQDLDSVTGQWLKVSQESLEDLRARVKNTMNEDMGRELTLGSLIQSLGLDPVLLQLDEGEDCFQS